jgi:hypothetical protein
VTDLNRYYRNYQQTVQPFYPLLLDPSAFEQGFLDVLPYITETGIDPALAERLESNSFESAAWYGLLFAVLALGCQISENEPKERVLRTRVLGKCPSTLRQNIIAPY